MPAKKQSRAKSKAGKGSAKAKGSKKPLKKEGTRWGTIVDTRITARGSRKKASTDRLRDGT